MSFFSKRYSLSSPPALIHAGIIVLLCLLLSSCKSNTNTDSEDEANFSQYRKGYGTSADALLTARTYTSLLVEVQYMKGFAPDEGALSNFRQFLQSQLHKPGGIYFSFKEIPAAQDTTLNREQLAEIHRLYRTAFTTGTQFSLYVLYTNGYYKKQSVLAHALFNSCIILYGAAVKANAESFTFPTQNTIETTLLLHEMGHLLGLVTDGNAMKAAHSDSSHHPHCENPNCVMYWSMAIAPDYGPLRLRPFPTFDSACLQDLGTRRRN